MTLIFLLDLSEPSPLSITRLDFAFSIAILHIGSPAEYLLYFPPKFLSQNKSYIRYILIYE